MYIDLSMLVNEQTVVFPGDAKPVFEPGGTLESDGFVDRVLHVNNHLGTHIDAPAHMLAGGAQLKSFSIERFIGPAVCIDARGRESLGADLLEGVDISAGVSVLFYTGRGDNHASADYATDYPAVSMELAEALVAAKPSMVGLDAISFDHDVPFPVHKALLGAEILLIENLINLESVVGKRFKLYALPVNFDLDAAPARVVAEV